MEEIDPPAREEQTHQCLCILVYITDQTHRCTRITGKDQPFCSECDDRHPERGSLIKEVTSAPLEVCRAER